MKNTYLFYTVFQVLKVIKNCKIQPPDLLFLYGLLAFSSAGIIFHKFLELHSKISEKNFHHQFSFLMDLLRLPTHPHPLNSQIPLSVKRVFCRCSLMRMVYFWVQNGPFAPKKHFFGKNH